MSNEPAMVAKGASSEERIGIVGRMFCHHVQNASTCSVPNHAARMYPLIANRNRIWTTLRSILRLKMRPGMFLEESFFFGFSFTSFFSTTSGSTSSASPASSTLSASSDMTFSPRLGRTWRENLSLD